MDYQDFPEPQIHLEDFDPPQRLVRAKIKQKYNGVCAYCETPSSSLTLDHVIPKSKGGPTAVYNLTPACYHCNQSKANYDLSEWYRLQPFWSQKRESQILMEFIEGHYSVYGEYPKIAA